MTTSSTNSRLANFGRALIVILITLIMIEGLLRILDPWGFVYFDDLSQMSASFVDDTERIYSLPDGTYDFNHWTATVSNQLRVTPNTNPDASCRIALLGDSVTFGYGVNDDETWVNILAEQYPNVYLMNTGVTTYPIEPIVGTYNVYRDDVDGFLYFIVSNDGQDASNTRNENLENPTQNVPLSLLYLGYYLIRLDVIDTPETVNAMSEEDTTRFLDNMAILAEEDNIAFMSFDEKEITDIAINAGYNVQVLPPYPNEHRISFLDVHLNATGNAVIAEEIAPILDALIEASCN